MKLFLDTNVLLDIFMRREPYYDASAQVVPMQKRRTIKKLPSLACKVDFADLCSDDSKMWDACNA